MEEVKTEKRFSLLTDDYTIPEEENRNIEKPELTKREIKQQEKAAKLEQKKEDKAHNGTLNEKREEKEQKEKDGNDSFEEGKKVVMDGAKLMCPFAVGEGKLVVSSNEITIQDQLWATEGDKNNMLNLQFEGICNHPNFAAYPVKPQCKSVIFLDKWTGVGTTKVQDQTVLIKDACIGCDPKPNVAVPQAPAATSSEESSNEEEQESEEDSNENLVEDAYWVKDNDGKNRITFLPYLEDSDKVHVLIKFKEDAIGKQATIKVYEYDSLSGNENVTDYTFSIEHANTIYSFNLTGSIFEKAESAGETAEFFFKIKTGDSSYKEFCNTSSKWLRVHKIRYIPEIMETKGWNKGFLLQKKWFNGLSNATPSNKADINNIITMDWALGFSRAKAIYDKMIIDKIWVNKAGKNALLGELNKMVKKGDLKLPTIDLQETEFGTFSLLKTKNSKGEVAPKIDVYHYQERAFKESTDIDDTGLDDLYAALANFVFRMAVKGKIKKEKDNYIITIQEVGTYVRDSFDFNDASIFDGQFISQPLGYWSVSENEVSTSDKGSSYTFIQNSNYQEYRKVSGFGMDFLVYSDVKTKRVQDKFTISKSQL